MGAPLVAGSPGPVASGSDARAFAEANGLPIAIKAAFGGGGRGLKVAWTLDEVEELFESATREALTAFGRGECFIEQFLDRPRHIEAQVLGDRHGRVKVLGTRDCSLQRRNQKLVEEAPAPFLTDEQRARIHAAARAICAKAGYSGAGTVEFLLSANGTLSFLEVNTRLQVEHPVTEETTGIDLVARDDPRRPGGAARRREPCRRRAAIRSSSASTPRTRAAASCRRRGRSRRGTRPPVPACGWTAAWCGLGGARHLQLADGEADRDRRVPRGGVGAGGAARSPSSGWRAWRRCCPSIAR